MAYYDDVFCDNDMDTLRDRVGTYSLLPAIHMNPLWSMVEAALAMVLYFLYWGT